MNHNILEKSLTNKNKLFLNKALEIPGKLNIAIVYPHNIEAIEGALLAAEADLINPIFLGSKSKMEE